MSNLWYGGVEWKVVYNTGFYFSFLLYILSFFTSTNASLIITETANILLGTALIFEICLYGGNIQNKSGLDIIQLIKYSLPFAVMLINIIYTLVLLFSNQDHISAGYVSPGFFTFINISTILVLLQLYIFLTNKKENIERLTPTSSSFILLLGIINIYCIITIYIILTYYTTDG